jgi:hypothetical protein
MENVINKGLACFGLLFRTVEYPTGDRGEIPNIRIMYNDIEHSISIDFYIYISIFQVFSLFIDLFFRYMNFFFKILYFTPPVSAF